ncbi:MAG: EAL domain-containing protein [Chloroflexi bacterium]|nr:EAL domain-containing protein [Chloroflexota bacterium]
MSGKFHGIFIGVNEYLDARNLRTLKFAEKDAQDIYKTFTDPAIGFSNPGEIKVLLGQQATKHNIEGTLHTMLVKNARPDDTVIVYYSGHGFLAGEEKTAYLGAFDTQIADIAFNPNSGLRMSYIYQDIFHRSPARNILFILDCCNSGAFIPPTLVKSSAGAENPLEQVSSTKELIDGKLLAFPDNDHTMARAVMFSSPSGVESREHEQYQNGVFTYYLLKGLRGDKLAVEAGEGEVTIDSLNSYIKRKVPEKQPSGFAGKVISRFVLTRNHGKREAAPSVQVDSEMVDSNAHLPISIIASPLASPFDSAYPFIRNITTRLGDFNSALGMEPGTVILNIIRDLYDAKIVFLLHTSGKEPAFNRFSSQMTGKDVTESELVSMAANRIAQGIEEKVFEAGNKGISHNIPSRQIAKYEKIMVVPIDKDDFLVIFATSVDIYIGEVYACILRSIYYATDEFTYISPELEASILDELKKTYGYIPFKMYEQRFKLFDDSLNNDTVFFEPILFLDSKNLDINGWEALAREAQAEHAPVNLFQAAELWGDKFMIQLDSYFLRLATERYREQLKKMGKRPNEFLPLSVNVYPASLMRSAYRKTLDDVINKDKSIPGHKIILEISEKLPVSFDGEENTVAGLRHFREQLFDLTKSFSVNFAIDDFGSGYSSISRFASLRPKYVKIDRDILLQKDICDITLQYIRQMTAIKETSATYVIVEGFDGSSDMAVSLQQIYEYDIRYVQGYIIGRAGPELYDLDEAAARRLVDMLTGYKKNERVHL